MMDLFFAVESTWKRMMIKVILPNAGTNQKVIFILQKDYLKESKDWSLVNTDY